jgi:hypothetical protein
MATNAKIASSLIDHNRHCDRNLKTCPPVNVATTDMFSWRVFPLALIATNRQQLSAYGVLRYGSDSLCSLNDSSLRVVYARSDFQ